jgi:long-chain acyl-CoA synthetase
MTRRTLKGLGHRETQLDLELYRIEVPIKDVPDAYLSVIDLCPTNPKKTLMFIHGYAGCGETFEYQINYFHRNYRVIVPDLRGHGQSDAPFTEYTMNELVDDINTIRSFLQISDKFVLIGHSFGGSICVEYAIKYPDQLEKLILISTAGEYPLPRFAALALQIPASLYRLFWKYRPRWNADVHVMKRMMMNNMRKWIGWEMLTKIQTPTLILTGAKDRYFPRRVFEGVYSKVPGAEVYDIGASKHKVQLERHDAVNRAIERFILKEEGGQHVSWREQAAIPKEIETRPWLSKYGKHTPWSIPIPKRTLHEYLRMTAKWVPNRVATVFYGSKMNYKQLYAQTVRFANALLNLGIKKGDRVMLVLPNMPQLITAYYAVIMIGGIVVLPNPEANGTMILHQINQTQAKVLITLQVFGELTQLMEENSSIKIIVTNIQEAVSPSIYKILLQRWETAGLSKEGHYSKSKSYLYMEQLIRETSEKSPQISVSPSDIAVILHTSGTTGEPKGVCLSHTNLVANMLQTLNWIPNFTWGKEVFLAILPLTHSYAMTIDMNIPIAAGATMILLSVFEMREVLTAIKKYHPTIFPGVPAIYAALNHVPNVYFFGLSSIKACISGAAPLPIEVKETFEKLTKSILVEGYGLTEASPVTHANPFGGINKIGSIGIPLPNTDAKIVDLKTGEALLPQKIGELLIKGPQVMLGYWNPQGLPETEGVIKDGWLFTGDIAIMDSDGYFQIIARKRDTILAGQYSVYPRDVEEVLYENSNVMEAAVIGIETGNQTQKIKAFVVPRPGTQLTKEELLDLCRRRLDEYAIPWDIEFRKELPKSFVGKVIRRMLLE